MRTRAKKIFLPVKKYNRGSAGFLFIAIILALLTFVSFYLVGGKLPSLTNTNPNPQEVVVDPFAPEDGKKNLQLYTFKGSTPTPAPFQPQPQGNVCAGDKFNEEPDIFLASDPPPGGVARAGSQVRVWVDDGNGGSISDGEKIDPATGRITTPGDRTATDGKGPGYYLWEPAIYLTPITSPTQAGPFSGDAENGGTPRFPTIVKGEVSYSDGGNDGGFIKGIPPIDPPVNVVGGRKGHGGHIAQFIWDVNTFGLAPGTYRAQIVIHDGDGDLAINCTTIQI